MKPINFEGSNKVLLKPESMTDEECGSLPVYTDGIICMSCWQPTIKERLSIIFGKNIRVFVLSGENQPPIALDIE